jgi:diguanylate cyclase (GGDEF)-like protein
MKPLSTRTLTAYYLTALLILAVLTICSHLVLDYVLRTNAGSAAVVNISGRQRMLSQRIASMAAQYRLGDASAKQELLTAADRLEAAHNKLMSEDSAGWNNDTYTRQLHALYFDAPQGLDRQVRSYVADARRFAAMPPGSPAAAALLSTIFAESRSSLLTNLNQAVQLHQLEGERRLSELEHLQWSILTIVLATLLLEALTIFRPMIRRITSYMSEILHLATTDMLTGIPNRRSFYESGAVELARARRYTRPLTLLMLDADNFKQVNDTYGHAAGDAVLKALAAALRSSIRETDVLARLGGEEFGILMPETAVPHAAGLAERLRSAIALLPVPVEDRAVSVTVSIGVAPVPNHTSGIEHAMRIADELLYQAKQRGRNCVVVADPQPA